MNKFLPLKKSNHQPAICVLSACGRSYIRCPYTSVFGLVFKSTCVYIGVGMSFCLIEPFAFRRAAWGIMYS